MEIKKSIEADLENDKSSFVLMGLLVALCAIFIAFEISQKDITAAKKDEVTQEAEVEEEMALVTEQNTPPPPPPPPAPEPIQQDVATDFVKNVNAAKNENLDQRDTKEEIDNAKPVIPAAPVAPKDDDDDDNTIYMKVQEKAQYPGGTPALGAFLNKNLQYPKAAAETGTQGKVIVEFTIEKDGSVSDVKVARSIDPALDKEAVRVVKLMKGWIPAKNGSKKVRCKFRLPVDFRLQ